MARSKYGAIRTEFNGRKFDSKAEALWAQNLEFLKKQGQIKLIEYQPRIELLPRPNLVTYVADFRVHWANGDIELMDVKGFETPVFKLKLKMFRHRYPQVKLSLVR